MKKIFSSTTWFWLILFKVSIVSAQYTPQDSIEIRTQITKAYDYAFNQPDSGIILAQELIVSCQQINYPYGEAHAHIFLADCFFSKGDYARTIYYLLRARTICAENNISALDQRINRPFGELYIELGEPRKAIDHQLRALQTSVEAEETAIVTKGLADAYYEAGNLDSALSYAKPLFEMAGELWAAVGITLGKIYTQQGKYEEALSAFRTKAGLTYELDLVNNYLGRAIVFDSLRQLDSTRFYASKALELAQEKRFHKFINEASALLASTYKMQDREKFLQYLLLSFAAKDSLYSREKMNQINNYVFADETRRRDLAAAEVRFATQKRTFLLSALSVILLTIGLFLWRNNRTKTRSNALLKEEKQKVESTLEQLKITQSQLIEAEKTARQLEMQEAERLRDMDQLKTRLYTNITHEFRTPLTVIMGMNDNISGHEQERSLIKRNARNLLRLINQLLDLSKLDSGTLKMEMVQDDIMGYLYYLTESFYSMASDKKVSLSFKQETDTLIMDFDEAKVQHIVYNLLSNAIKFTRPGGKVILEADEIVHQGTTFVQIKVKDTGDGIPKKDLPHIFDRFYQVNGQNGSDKTHTVFAGTGIGLAFVKELVELSGGTIEVASEMGWGTEFTVRLPIIRNSATPKLTTAFKTKAANYNFTPEYESLPATPDQMPGDKLQVLLVEDNAGVTTYIKSLLDKIYHVQVAINGKEGIDMALEQIPDLIITDVMMPEKNGYEVCEILKNDERTSHIPIIMLTAKADLSSKIEGLEMGADAYLSKPFEKEELLVRLRKLFELRQALQEHYENHKKTMTRTDQSPSLEDQFLGKIHTFINDHLEDSTLTIPEISQFLQLSHTQFYRKLKAITGKTPSQFVNAIRMEKAHELLLHSHLNISEVAYKVGFSDPNYFSRIFKKEFGKTPGEIDKGD